MPELTTATGKIWPQVLAAVAANMGGFAWGNAGTWSATALPKVREDADFGSVSEDEISWISSMALLGACLAGIPTGMLVDKIGRRRLMLTLSVPLLGGWLLMYFAQNVAMLIAGRTLTGFCAGAYSSTAPMFIAETSQARIRGMLISGFDLLITVGILLVFVIGAYLSWRNQALVCAFVPIVCFGLMYIVPESPRYLLSKGSSEEGAKSLQWLRGASGPEDIKAELFAITENIEAHKMESLMATFKGLWSPSVRTAMLLSFALFFFQVMSGINAIMFYTVDVFRAAGSSMDEYEASMVVGVAQVIAAVSSASVVDRFGRRVLLIASEILIVVSLSGLGAFFNIKKNSPEYAENNLGWLPLTCFLIYATGYSIGMGPIPFSVSPEILPQSARGLASSILTTFKWGVAFIITKFFYKLREGLGDDGCYWFFASFCVLGAMFIYSCIPETKGKSLEEIHRHLNKKYNPRKSLS